MISGISLPIIAGGVSFVTFSFLGNTFEPNSAFAALSLFNLLRLTMSFFPSAVKGIAEFHVSLKRLQNIMDMPELEIIEQGHDEGRYVVLHAFQLFFCFFVFVVLRFPFLCRGVVLENASFTWNPEANESVLQDISFKAPAGKITALVGTIGSGKTRFFSFSFLSPKKTLLHNTNICFIVSPASFLPS